VARVLCCWEIGAAFGHLHTLIPITRALAAVGHEIVLAARDVVEPWKLLRDLPAKVIVAPRPAIDPRFASTTVPKGNFTGLLATNSYASPDLLEPLLRAWDGIFDVVNPALVVCDYAPTACLAAYGRVPVVVAGNGYSVPPATAPDFPPFEPGARSCADPAEVLATIRAALRSRGRPEPATITEPFAAATTFITTYPELDPYGRTRAGGVVGPLAAPQHPPSPPARDAFFAYLTAQQPGVLDVLRRLTEANVPGIAYLRQRPPGVAEYFAGTSLTLLDAPADIAKVLPEVRVVLHHGGVGLAEAALTAGRPQVIVPLQGEQFLTGQKLRDLGVCLPVLTPSKPIDVVELVTRALREPAPLGPAMAVAERLFAEGPWDALARVVEHCRSVVG
jgi:rhamnosyltransferase subunit B